MLNKNFPYKDTRAYTTTYTCKFCLQTFFGHHKRIVCGSASCLEERIEELRIKAIKRTEQHREKNRDKRSTPSNTTKCVRCHKPKGANRWYCHTCHRYLTNLYGDLEEYNASTTHRGG